MSTAMQSGSFAASRLQIRASSFSIRRSELQQPLAERRIHRRRVKITQVAVPDPLAFVFCGRLKSLHASAEDVFAEQLDSEPLTGLVALNFLRRLLVEFDCSVRSVADVIVNQPCQDGRLDLRVADPHVLELVLQEKGEVRGVRLRLGKRLPKEDGSMLPAGRELGEHGAQPCQETK